MSPQNDDAFEDWMSLYSQDVETTWTKENEKELRRISMLVHAFNQEFKRVEDNLNNKAKILKQQFSNDKENIKTSVLSTPTKPKSQAAVMSKRDSPLVKSPKLSLKHRKSLHLIKDKNKLNVPTVSAPKFSSEDLFESSQSSTLSDESFEISSNKLGIEFLRDNKRKSNHDVVDSSFVIQQTPNKPLAKKMRVAKKILSKDTSNKLKDNSSESNNTLTQMFAFPNIGVSSKNKTKLKLTLKEKEPNKELKEQPKDDFLVPPSFLKDYDKVPVTEDKRPQHIHKTETVRRKLDRMKLPGWSCEECKEYYEGSNLSPDELRKKMDICSKHRNRFPPSNETIAGFWDVVMPDSQETQNDDDVTVIQF